MEKNLHYFKLVLSCNVAFDDYVKDIEEEDFIKK